MKGNVVERSDNAPKPLFKGGIVEKKPAAPKPLVGKPIPKPIPPPQVPRNGSAIRAPAAPVSMMPDKESTPYQSSDAEFNDNDALISSMSAHEIDEAVAEIKSLLSKTSLDFLLGKKKPAESHTVATADEVDEPPELESIQPTEVAESIAQADALGESLKTSSLADNEMFNLDGQRMFDDLAAATSAVLSGFEKSTNVHVKMLPEDVKWKLAVGIASEFSGAFFAIGIVEDAEEELCSFDRIVELARSQIRSQQVSSFRMIRGILRLRDQAVSMLSYCPLTSHASGSLNSSLQSLSVLLQRFQSCMATSRAALPVEMSISDADLSALVQVGLTALGASDLPAELAKIMLLGWRFVSFSNPVLLTARLECLLEYMTSSVERSVADLLTQQCNVHRSDIPRFVSGHAIRPDSSYEQWHLDRLEALAYVRKSKTSKPSSADDGLSALGPGLSFDDQFTLRSRWSRVDIVGENDDLLDLLQQCIMRALSDQHMRASAAVAVDILDVIMTHGLPSTQQNVQSRVIHPLCSHLLSSSATASTSADSSQSGPISTVFTPPWKLLSYASHAFIQARLGLCWQLLEWSTTNPATLLRTSYLLEAVHSTLRSLSADALVSALQSWCAQEHFPTTCIAGLHWTAAQLASTTSASALDAQNRRLIASIVHISCAMTACLPSVSSHSSLWEALSVVLDELYIHDKQDVDCWTVGLAAQCLVHYFPVVASDETSSVFILKQLRDAFSEDLWSELVDPLVLLLPQQSRGHEHVDNVQRWHSAMRQTVLRFLEGIASQCSELNDINLTYKLQTISNVALYDVCCNEHRLFASELLNTIMSITGLRKRDRSCSVKLGLVHRVILQQSSKMQTIVSLSNSTSTSSEVDWNTCRRLLFSYVDCSDSLATSMLQWSVYRVVENAQSQSSSATLSADTVSDDVNIAVSAVVHALTVSDPRHKLKLATLRDDDDAEEGAEAQLDLSDRVQLTWPLTSERLISALEHFNSLDILMMWLKVVSLSWNDLVHDTATTKTTVNGRSLSQNAWYALMRMLRREAAAVWYSPAADTPEEHKLVFSQTVLTFMMLAAKVQESLSAENNEVDADWLLQLYSRDYSLAQWTSLFQSLPSSASDSDAFSVVAKQRRKQLHEGTLSFCGSLLDNALNHTMDEDSSPHSVSFAALSLLLLSSPHQPTLVRRRLWQELRHLGLGHLMFIGAPSSQVQGFWESMIGAVFSAVDKPASLSQSTEYSVHQELLAVLCSLRMSCDELRDSVMSVCYLLCQLWMYVLREIMKDQQEHEERLLIQDPWAVSLLKEMVSGILRQQSTPSHVQLREWTLVVLSAMLEQQFACQNLKSNNLVAAVVAVIVEPHNTAPALARVADLTGKVDVVHSTSSNMTMQELFELQS